MKLTFMIIAIAVLLLLIIGYNIILDCKDKAKTKKRQLTIRHRQVIEGIEDLLLNPTSLPYSKVLTLILYSRMHDSLIAILQVDPSLPQVRQRLTNVQNQIAQLKHTPAYAEISTFRTPDSDREIIILLKQMKQIRSVLRTECAKNKVSSQTFMIEDHKIELMQLNVNIDNLLNRAYEARAKNQFGTCKQLLQKGIHTLNNINDKNELLIAKLQTLVTLLHDVNEQATQISLDNLNNSQTKENEFDGLFQPKKKWL